MPAKMSASPRRSPFRETIMRSLLVLAAAFAALSVAGCNTIAGMGQDTAAAGHAVTNTANDAK
jgi:entericidin B